MMMMISLKEASFIVAVIGQIAMNFGRWTKYTIHSFVGIHSFPRVPKNFGTIQVYASLRNLSDCVVTHCVVVGCVIARVVRCLRLCSKSTKSM